MVDLPGRWSEDFKGAAAASRAVRDMLKVYDPRFIAIVTHFLGDALPGEWGAAKTNGTSAAVTVATGQLTLTTGTDNDGYAGQGYGLFWLGDNGIYMESMQALDTLTTSKIEIGLTDSIADAGAVATKATPTGTADDFCVLVRDTDDNTELDLISELDNGGPSADAEDVYTVVAATNFKTAFRAQDDVVAAYVADKLVGVGSMQGGDLVSPWWFAQARAMTASRIMTVEYAICIGGAGLDAVI